MPLHPSRVACGWCGLAGPPPHTVYLPRSNDVAPHGDVASCTARTRWTRSRGRTRPTTSNLAWLLQNKKRTHLTCKTPSKKTRTSRSPHATVARPQWLSTGLGNWCSKHWWPLAPRGGRFCTRWAESSLSVRHAHARSVRRPSWSRQWNPAATGTRTSSRSLPRQKGFDRNLSLFSEPRFATDGRAIARWPMRGAFYFSRRRSPPGSAFRKSPRFRPRAESSELRPGATRCPQGHRGVVRDGRERADLSLCVRRGLMQPITSFPVDDAESARAFLSGVARSNAR